MNRFNLTFSGEIQAGQDAAQVKLRFGKMFAIDDPIRLERFFSGQPVILRRNLERKAAAQYYHELQQLGVVAALVKVAASEAVDAIDNAPPPPAKTTPARVTVTAKRSPVKKPTPLPTAGAPAQTWAVRSNGATRNSTTAPIKKAAASARRDKTDIAAKIKVRKEQSLQQAVAKAAQARAELEEQQRRAAEENARLEAEKQRQEEEAAKRQALAAEAARKAAEEAARKEAERVELKRREAAEAARKKALKAEARRKAAAEAARQKAQREQEKAERARLKAEEAARRKAELEEIKRREAEEAARLQAELAELQRREAEEAARLQAELAEIKRQEAEEAARIKAEALRKEAQAQRESAERRRAAAAQVAAKRALRREERSKAAVPRAVPEPVVPPTLLKHPKARIKTSLEVPQRKTIQPADTGTPPPRQRQLGEPNLYMLRPFRNSDNVRARSAQAQRRTRQGYTLGAIALAVLLIAGGSFLRQHATAAITGAAAIVIDPRSAPLLLAGDRLLLHDRAGISTSEVPLSELGVSALTPPLAFDQNGALIALGRLSSDSVDAAAEHASYLLRCELTPPKCQHFSPQLKTDSISTFVIHPLDGSLLVADSAAGELLKINRSGQLVARAVVNLPAQPVLRLHGGLLLMNSADGPAISVFRYEDKVFGQQLDEILLLPPAAQQTAQSRVGDFLWSSGVWWASLQNPVSGNVGLYRFDEKWTYRDEVELPPATGPLQLVSWGEKTLVNDARRPAALRFNAQREVEAPFASSHLADLVAGQQRRAALTTTAWRTGLLLCFLLALLGCGFGYLQKLRSLVYKAQRERGAEPVDDYVDALQWIDPVPNRLALLRRRTISYSLLAVGVLLLAIALSVTTWQLAALLLALSGPAIALLLLSRYPVGHIGVMQDKLLLVDHRGMYHIAAGSGVQHHGPFLLIDDVVVFTGSHLLPAFVAPQLQKLVRPLALGGVKVDRDTLVVKLLQCRHPFAQGACVMLATTAAAAMLFCLHGIF